MRAESVAAAGWRISLLGARTNQCDGDLWLIAPGNEAPIAASGLAGGQVLWTSYLEHLGESRLIGPYPAGTELILGLKPASYCTEPEPRPSTGIYARVAVVTDNTWDIWWEDAHDLDFDDLVVRVEAIPLSHQGSSPVLANVMVADVPNYATSKRSHPLRRARR
jgi:hypothetical protein